MPSSGSAPTIDLSRPNEFTASGVRDESWRYALLGHRGGHLFKTRVNMQAKAVEFEYGLLENHFVQRRSNGSSGR